MFGQGGALQDPRLLLSGQSVEVPQPLDIATQMMKLGDLARMRDIRDMELKTKKRAQTAAEQLAQALPLLAAGKSVQELAAQFPEAAGELITKDLAMQKDRRAIAKDETEAKAKETERRIKALDQVGNLAFTEANNPNPLSIKRVISMASYYGINLPFPTTNVDDPNQAKAYLKMLGDQAYDIKDREQNRLRGEHDRKQEELTAARDAATRTNQEVSRQQEWARINNDRFSQPMEMNVDGKQTVVVFDKVARRFVDANSLGSSAAMGSGGGAAPAPQAAPQAPMGFGMRDRGMGGMPAGAPASAGGGLGVIGPKLPPQTEGARNDLRSIDQQLAVMQRGLQYVESTPSAFNFARGIPSAVPTDKLTRAAESIAGRTDTPAERQARAYLFNVVSKIIHERAGSAQTPQEQNRLNGFLPGDHDGPEQIKDKLRGFIQYLKDMRGANPASSVPTAPRSPSLAPMETAPQPQGQPRASTQAISGGGESFMIDDLIVTPRPRQ